MALDPTVPPLMYPAILIPTAPMGNVFTGPQGRKLVHWRYEFRKYCVAHARAVLEGLEDNALEARTDEQ